MGLYDLALLTTERSYTYIGVLSTIAGMGVVFLTLIVIALLISVFGKGINSLSKKDAAKTSVAKETVTQPAPVVEPVDESDDLELVAVITACIAASMNTSNDKLVVKSLRRVGQARSAWNAAGRKDSVQSY